MILDMMGVRMSHPVPSLTSVQSLTLAAWISLVAGRKEARISHASLAVAMGLHHGSLWKIPQVDRLRILNCVHKRMRRLGHALTKAGFHWSYTPGYQGLDGNEVCLYKPDPAFLDLRARDWARLSVPRPVPRKGKGGYARRTLRKRSSEVVPVPISTHTVPVIPTGVLPLEHSRAWGSLLHASGHRRIRCLATKTLGMVPSQDGWREIKRCLWVGRKIPQRISEVVTMSWAQGTNAIAESPRMAQIDDIPASMTASMIDIGASAIIRTSEERIQAWFHASMDQRDAQAMAHAIGYGANVVPSRWTRIPGSINRKSGFLVHLTHFNITPLCAADILARVGLRERPMDTSPLQPWAERPDHPVRFPYWDHERDAMSDGYRAYDRMIIAKALPYWGHDPENLAMFLADHSYRCRESRDPIGTARDLIRDVRAHHASAKAHLDISKSSG
jgi:hypothetical protein